MVTIQSINEAIKEMKELYNFFDNEAFIKVGLDVLTGQKDELRILVEDKKNGIKTEMVKQLKRD